MGNKKKLSRKTKSHSYKENAKLMNDVIRKKKLQNSNESEVSHIVKRPRLGDKNEINSSKDDYHELTTVESLGIRGENTSTNKNDETSKHTIEVEIVPENETVQASLEKEDTGYDIEMENATDNVIKVGRRIINVSKFLEKLYHISNHGPLDCGFSCLQLVGEKLHGLSSKLTFLCKMCKLRFVLETDDEDGCLPVNACAVAATISIGCGHSQLQQFTSAVNLPIISQKTYRDSHKLLSENWEQLAQQSMNQAAEEERNIAIAEGNVTKDGTPVIDVLVDGVYSKRSYKKNYSALSGAAAIIGRKKGKILYMGVRNKYCYHCDRAEKRKSTIPKHFCCKNYTGPSTGMESEIIVEGFRQSLSVHGLIYGRMISDGDSSTYSKILQARPYKDVTVEKIECKNHLLRNFCNKMQSLQTDAKHLVKHRKLLTAKRIMVMRSTIIKSIKNNKSHPCPQEEHLFDDISQAHNHAFGNHVKCKTYFCNKTGIVEQDEMIKEFNLSTLWQKICLLIQGIACHARSLLHDVDSNIVENYHSIIAKYVGGKRINFSLRNSYQTRCMASAVSFNEENALSKLYKKITHKSPRGKLKMLEDRRSKMKKLSKRYTRKKTRQTFLGKRTKDDKHYGDKCEKPDVPEDVLEKIKQDFLNSLKKTDSERAVIERKTILQSASGEWLEMRRSLLTASNFSRVIKRRPNTLCANLVKDILYKKNLDHVESINHGQKCEKAALAQLAVQEKIVIKPCGLFIDKDLFFLGASPDGLIRDDKIVEIKCPLTVNKLGLDAAIRNKKLTFWTITKSGKTVNKKHPWFYQIQGQLHITQRKMCLFAVWVNETEKLKTEVIQRDDEFWDKQMKDKLIKFYMDCLLPEILDPRISRNMKIREPYRTPECSQPDINHETRDGNNDRDKDSDVTEPTADDEYSYRQNRIEDEDQENNFLEVETSRRCLDFSYF